MNAPQAGRLLTRKEGAVGWIVFSNVAKHNAVSYDMWAAFPEAMRAFEADSEVRAIVVTGDGEKAFISGADISQFEKARSSADAQATYNAAVETAYLAPLRCAKPVIARIRGICMGGGLGLAAASDLRFAADDAVFRMPAARLGLGYNYPGIKRFVELIGPANTADIFFSARKFDAADALRMGFLNRMVPAADLDRELAAYLRLVAENAPLTMAEVKYGIRQALAGDAERDLEGLKRMIEACFASEDYREGRTAFMEKRTPKFRGR
jgi:enoyl-CoA hydratase/carnithine racemase